MAEAPTVPRSTRNYSGELALGLSSALLLIPSFNCAKAWWIPEMAVRVHVCLRAKQLVHDDLVLLLQREVQRRAEPEDAALRAGSCTAKI